MHDDARNREAAFVHSYLGNGRMLSPEGNAHGVPVAGTAHGNHLNCYCVQPESRVQAVSVASVFKASIAERPPRPPSLNPSPSGTSPRCMPDPTHSGAMLWYFASSRTSLGHIGRSAKHDIAFAGLFDKVIGEHLIFEWPLLPGFGD